MQSEADCTICPPGEFCSHSGLSAPNGSCYAGYYCTNASEEANPVGQSYGDECPVGHFCPEQSHMPTPCPPGTYNPFPQMTNISACLQCDPGMLAPFQFFSKEDNSCIEETVRFLFPWKITLKVQVIPGCLFLDKNILKIHPYNFR